MNAFNLILIGVMLILALLVIGGIILVAIKGGKVGRWILVTSGIVFGLLLLAMLMPVFASRRVQSPTAHIQSMPAIAEPANVTPPIWMPGMENEFTASSYASILSAANALARQAERFLSQLNPQKLIVTGNVSHKILIPISTVIQNLQTGTYPVEIAENINVNNYLQEHESEIIVSIDVTLEDPVITEAKPPMLIPPSVEHGTMRMTIHAPGKQQEVSTEYFDRLWVDNFAEFLNRSPDIHWILARSQTSCTSEAQARREALRDALQQLQGRYLVEVGGKGPVALSEADITNGNFIVDRFTQSLAGSATPIWREAILIDASPNKIVQAASKITTVTTQTRKSWAGKGLSLLGMLALICLVYGFLNLATRGYYTWALRILAVVLLAAGLLALLTFS